jgi:hypothetical protein
MTISRTNVATYLHTQFSNLAASVGQAASDGGATGYGPDIDAALRKLGTSESDLATATVEDSYRESYFALAEYYAARRFWRQLGDRVNRRTGNNTFDFSHQLKTAKAIMDDAASRLAGLGYDVSGTGWTVGDLNLDWLEPEVLTP